MQGPFPHAVTLRRFVAAALAAVLALGACGLCAGWEAVAEAGAAEGATCPLHEASGDGIASGATQAAAARCCVASDQAESTPPESVFLPRVDLGQAVSLVPVVVHPAVVSRVAWRSLRPPPGDHVPKHLLLSVFLI